MRHQPHKRKWMRVAECGQRGTCHHESGYGLLADVGEFASLHHAGLAVLGELAVHVHSASGLAGSDLGRESEVYAVFVCNLAHRPLGNHQLVCSLLYVDGQELYLVLLVVFSVSAEVAHLGVSVLDVAAALRYAQHSLRAEVGELAERGALVIASLVCDRVEVVVGGYYVVLQLSHSLHLKAGEFGEFPVCLLEDILRRTLERMSVAVVERAQKVYGESLGERVYECRPVFGYHVQVALSGFHEGEEA